MQILPPRESFADYAIFLSASVPTAVLLARATMHTSNPFVALLFVAPSLWFYYLAIRGVRWLYRRLIVVLGGQLPPRDPTLTSGAEIASGVLGLAGILAVLFDPNDWLSIGLASLAIAICCWQCPRALRIYYLVPTTLVLASLFVPERYGLGTLGGGSEGGMPMTAYLVSVSGLLRYLAVCVAVILRKASSAAFWRVLLVFAAILLATFAALVTSLIRGGASPLRNQWVDHTADEQRLHIVLVDDRITRFLIDTIGFSTARVIVLAVTLGYLALPLTLRIAWEAVHAHRVSDAVVRSALEAHAWLSALALALLSFNILTQGDPLLGIPSIIILAAYASPGLQVLEVGKAVWEGRLR